MNILERFSGIFLIAGVVLLIGAMLSLGIIPAMMVDRVHPKKGLPIEIPEDFKQYYSSVEQYHKALVLGVDVYKSEGCWHCHSQYVRPVGNEVIYYGPVSTPGEYQNILNMPQLFGTRRVGPDLTRESGRRTNDWHFAHLYSPMDIEPLSVMPSYTWLFDNDGTKITPNKKAVALVAYLQWLGHAYKDLHYKRTASGKFVEPPNE